jgi:hypothetical protein
MPRNPAAKMQKIERTREAQRLAAALSALSHWGTNWTLPAAQRNMPCEMMSRCSQKTKFARYYLTSFIGLFAPLVYTDLRPPNAAR